MKKDESPENQSKPTTKPEPTQKEQNLFKKVKTEQNSSLLDEHRHIVDPASFIESIPRDQ